MMRPCCRSNTTRQLRKDDTKLNKNTSSHADDCKHYNLHIEPQTLVLSTKQLKSRQNKSKQPNDDREIYLSSEQNEYTLKNNQQDFRDINNQLNDQLLDKERRITILSQSLMQSEQDREQLKQKEIQHLKYYEMREQKNQEELRELVGQLNAQLLDQQTKLQNARDRLVASEQKHKQSKQKDIQFIKTYEQRDEANQQDLREIINRLNLQLSTQERELQNVRQNLLNSEQEIEQLKQKENQHVKHLEIREDEILQLLRQERQRNEDLSCELNYFSKEVRFREDNFKKLEESQTTLNRIIEDQQRRIEEDKNQYTDLKEQLKVTNEKLEVSQKSLQNLEQRYIKVKTKQESETQTLKEDKYKYLKKYKAKIAQLKPMLKINEDQINQLNLDIMKYKSEKDNLNDIIRSLEHQLQSYQSQLPSIEKQNMTNMQSYVYQNENERLLLLNNQLNEAYQNRNEEYSQQSYHLQQAVNHLEKLTTQYETTQQEYEKLLYTYEKVQGDFRNAQLMLDQVCEMGHTQMDDLDTKVSRMNSQLQQAHSDKNSLQKENSLLKQEAQNIEMNEQILEKHLMKQKKQNKILQRQLGEVNNNLKEIIVEKHSEMKSNSKMLSQNMSYISMKNKMDHILSSNSKRDFLRIEEDSMQDI